MASPVYVIGGGPGGLATAAALQARGTKAVVLERSPAVAASWRGHYDRLHLHTPRRLSGLPGMPIPRRFGRWVSRDDVITYLEAYVAHHGLDVRFGVDVQRIDRDSSGSVLRTADGDLLAPTVVVATGYNHTPLEPSWPGLDTFTGEVVHASRYRNARPYAGRDVLVVGAGNTGAEIAVDLVEGGAGQVWLAFRTIPHIVRRTTAGWPAQGTGILVRRLPAPVVDRLARAMSRVSVPDLARYGLPRPDTGLLSRVLEGSVPVQDVGLIAAVRARSVTPVAAVEACAGAEVLLRDGRRLSPQVVIAATGYSRGLEQLVGHLGVLDHRGRPRAHGGSTPLEAPGLYFTGYTNPISGMFRELRIDARRIARAVSGRAWPRAARHTVPAPLPRPQQQAGR